MSNDIKIVQLNIRGILSSDVQHRKCHKLNKLLEDRQIDVALLQEWSATKRQKITKETNTFPENYFPNYTAHFHSTECAILYHNGLTVTPLPLPSDYLNPNHRNNFHICGIILHSQTTDYGIYSVYKPQKAQATQIFKYQFETDHIIIGGDFNIHHPLWGDSHSCRQGNDFLNSLTASNLTLQNSQTPTRLDPRSGTLTSIDLTLTSFNISNIKWRADHCNHDPSLSDHFLIFFNIPLNSHENETTYHSTWNLSSKTKWKKFKNQLHKNLNNLTNLNNASDFAEQLNSIIYDTAISTIGYRKYIRTYKPWRNHKIATLQKIVKKLKRKLDKIKQKHPDYFSVIPKYNRILLEYKDLRNQKIQEIRKAKKRHLNKINKILQHSSFNDKLSWRLIKKHKTSPNIIPSLKYDNKIITDPTTKSEILHKVLCHPDPPNLLKNTLNSTNKST